MGKFFFTIVDDTDDATLENIKPIYDFLYDKNILITKTIWVYPPLDPYSKGDSLMNEKYAEYIKNLSDRGFEIGIHNIGSGNDKASYKREDILAGLEIFKEKLGFYPSVCVNHSYNPDSIYGGYKRFNFPFNYLVRKFYPQYGRTFYGEEEDSPYFWGDKYKEIIRYSRNHECFSLNTTKYDPYMPYIDPHRSKYANCWYSATFAPNPNVFNYLVNSKSLSKLEKEEGICVLFTHLGYYCKNGVIEKGFMERINMLSNNPNGVYKPLSYVLDYIANKRKENSQCTYPIISNFEKFNLEIRHLLTRIYFRKFLKMDDYSFKGLNKEMFLK